VYLKALTIKGFKSFADAATLQFEPGVTVVVGPNGSGKSNVVDAVAWVLGAQGPRTVRSSKMEDVIFAGSADRSPLGRAEVSLTIDNRSGRLPGGLAEITITRTLFRSGDSEYALNGQSCRLLDVQELLSDSGVGRQQHVIVSQGQLDQILQARPEDRRGVIEEAAGVLKHRRRRERAERRLLATEENLERLGDLVREVKRQIRPLERQAVAARSFAALSEERRTLRLYLVGQELSAIEDRVDAARHEQVMLTGRERDLRDQVAQFDNELEATTADLSSQRQEDVVAVLGRVQGLAERCRGLAGVLVERRRSLDRALDEAADTDVVSTLEAEAARLSADLQTTEAEFAELDPRTEEVVAAEAALAEATAAAAVDAEDLAAQRQAQERWTRAQGEIAPLRQSLQREQTALQRIDERLAAIEQRRAALSGERDQLSEQVRLLDAELPEAERRAVAAAAAAAAASAAAKEAETAARQADRDRHRAAARAETLVRAVEDVRGSAGLVAVAAMSGVVGLVGDTVEVDEGWRLAFEAAAGSALAGLAVEGSVPARAVLERLAQEGTSGTVLVPPAPDTPVTTVIPPEGTEAVRAHVRGRSYSVERLLDRLVGDAVVVAGGWEEAADVALAHPGLVVVTAAGARFAANGWRLQAADTVATQAAVDEALAAAKAAEVVADAATTTLAALRQEAELSAEESRRCSRDVERIGDRRQSVTAALARTVAQLSAVEEELAAAGRHRVEAVERIERDRAQVAAIEQSLPELEAAAQAAAETLAAAASARADVERRRAVLAQVRRELEVRAAGLAERRTVLVDRLADVERRLAGHVAERERAAARRRRLEAEAAVVDRLGRVVDQHAARLAGLLQPLQQRRDRQLAELRQGGARIEALRQQRVDADGALAAVRQQLQQLQIELAQAEVRRQGAVERLQRELGCDVEEAKAARCPQLPDGVAPADRAAEVEAALQKLGPVNPLALDELAEVEERYQFLDGQVEDVRAARRELQQVIRTVDDEVVRVFAEAFADVNEHFQSLVGTLFPGGTGRLSLTDPADLLHTGVEVEVRPAGKNVRKLTLLSGGERSLVAMAFLFAVFRSRPSPFYLMDEVEAALDDVNLHRFLGLVHEFRGEAQLIIVSHQKRTMESADALYGVTMQAGGSSKVVSQKVRKDPAPSGEPAGAVEPGTPAEPADSGAPMKSDAPVESGAPMESDAPVESGAPAEPAESGAPVEH